MLHQLLCKFLDSLSSFFYLNRYLSGLIQQAINRRYLFYFTPKIGFDISCKLFATEMFCMKCQLLSFLGGGVIFDPLTFTTFWANSAYDKLVNVKFLSRKQDLTLSLLETICIKCQILFSGKQKIQSSLWVSLLMNTMSKRSEIHVH